MSSLRNVFFTGLALLASAVYNLGAAPIQISPTTLPGWTVGIPYSQTLTASGCTPCIWSEIGALPPGLSLRADSGLLSGTPSSTGSYGFTVFATSGLNFGSQAFSIAINSAIRITTTSLPVGQIGSAYAQTIAFSGGTAPYTFSISAGSLPGGLSLASSTGSITGTPNKSGSFPFNVQVTDHTGATDVQAYTVTVSGGAPPAITTGSALPNGTVGASYSATLAATGGTTPYSWSITTGTLPAGLALNATTGTIAGTPNSAGAFTFTASVTDHNSLSSSRAFSLTVAAAGVNPTLSITGVPQSSSSAQQITFGLVLSAPYTQTITGQVTLAFQPSSSNPMDDPAIQFSTGGRTASFTIPARATAAIFAASAIAFQTGTVSGTITLNVTSNLPGAGPASSIAIASDVPVIQNTTVSTSASGFQIQVSGFSNTRELVSAIFHFTAITGKNIQTADLTVPLSTAGSTWFASNTSAQFGGQLLLAVPFTIQQGAQSTIASVTVTLNNGHGASQPATTSFQ